MSDLTQLLPQERRIAFAGKEWRVAPLTFNSLAKIEDKFGSLDKMDLTKIKDQRYLLWVILSASEPELTEQAVGDLLTVDKMESVVAFIGQALHWSGLTASPDAPSGAPPSKNDGGQEDGAQYRRVIAFLVIKMGLSLKDIGALTIPQAQILIEEYALLTGAEPPRGNAQTPEPDAPHGAILLDSLYEAVKARMEANPQ